MKCVLCECKLLLFSSTTKLHRETSTLLVKMALVFISLCILITLNNAANGNGMNVLFIASDDLRPDLAGLYGQSQIYTPNIDRLMQNGVTFTHSYTQCPICSPSRTSFLTGLRPDTTRVWYASTFASFSKINNLQRQYIYPGLLDHISEKQCQIKQV